MGARDPRSAQQIIDGIRAQVDALHGKGAVSPRTQALQEAADMAAHIQASITAASGLLGILVAKWRRCRRRTSSRPEHSPQRRALRAPWCFQGAD